MLPEEEASVSGLPLLPQIDTLVKSGEYPEDDHRTEDAFGSLVGHRASAFEDNDNEDKPDADRRQSDPAFQPLNFPIVLQIFFGFHPAILT